MALRLIYQIFATLLGWVVLQARSDTSEEIEATARPAERTDGRGSCWWTWRATSRRSTLAAPGLRLDRGYPRLRPAAG
jgi:hypothetical protein